MPYGLIITVDYTRPPGVMARKWSDFTKAANEVVANTWHGKYLPHHFAAYGKPRYRLATREPATRKKKEALARGHGVKYGGLRPLVHTGLGEEQVKRRGILRVFPKRFTLTMPSHIPRRPRHSKIDLHDEITRTIPSEDRYLASQWQATIHAKLDSYKPRRRVKV